MKKALMAGVVICSNVFGNLLLKAGMDQVPPLQGPLSYISAIFQPLVAAGIVLLILWVLSRMALLSWADLTYALPMTSLGFVLNLAVAAIFLHEPVSTQRLAGTALIVIGTLFVAFTKPKTVEPAA